MDVEEFVRWLKLGLGRTVLHLQKHDAAPYRESILKACLHNQAYDQQLEGSRADYMLDIIALTDHQPYFREQILQTLASLPIDSDSWDKCQLFNFARIFAQRGDLQARHSMYQAYETRSSISYILGIEVVALDGLDGLKYVAEKMGQDILLEAETSADDWLVGYAEDKFGEATVWQFLQDMAARSPNVKAYVAAIEKLRQKRKQNKGTPRIPAPNTSYAEVRKSLPRGPQGGLVMWGQQATSQEIELAANDVLTETDVDKLRFLLKIFWKRQFPFSPDHLIALATNSDNDRLVNAAMRAISAVTHPTVRDLAMRILTTPGNEYWVPDLLLNNFVEGDHAIIEELIQRLTDDQDVHNLVFDLPRFYAAHRNDESEIRSLLLAYEKGPCANCRERFVKRLIELGQLPEWMAQECLWDSNFDTRQLVRDYLSGTSPTANQQSEITNQQSRSV